MRTLHLLRDLDIRVGELGATVRRGIKWADLLIGEEIGLCRCTNPNEHKIIGHGGVKSVQLYRFKDLPQKVLDYEQYHNCRNYEGLLDTMKIAYDGFDENEIVTAFFYTRII